VRIVKVALDAILMRSVFCFEMFQWPPRLFLAWGKSEEKSSLAIGPASSVRSGDHSLFGDVSEQKDLSLRKTLYYFGKK